MTAVEGVDVCECPAPHLTAASPSGMPDGVGVSCPETTTMWYVAESDSASGTGGRRPLSSTSLDGGAYDGTLPSSGVKSPFGSDSCMFHVRKRILRNSRPSGLSSSDEIPSLVTQSLCARVGDGSGCSSGWRRFWKREKSGGRRGGLGAEVEASSDGAAATRRGAVRRGRSVTNRSVSWRYLWLEQKARMSGGRGDTNARQSSGSLPGRAVGEESACRASPLKA